MWHWCCWSVAQVALSLWLRHWRHCHPWLETSTNHHRRQKSYRDVKRQWRHWRMRCQQYQAHLFHGPFERFYLCRQDFLGITIFRLVPRAAGETAADLPQQPASTSAVQSDRITGTLDPGHRFAELKTRAAIYRLLFPALLPLPPQEQNLLKNIFVSKHFPLCPGQMMAFFENTYVFWTRRPNSCDSASRTPSCDRSSFFPASVDAGMSRPMDAGNLDAE